ncbi:Catabolite degradation [Mycena venus]|uniref:Catabolite degradation n=1 Tax=Mycena venus TaxID=2733690 RepID=A0A8H7CIN7_9AGAR|nr:Catabolite degradation [Mycena venus]
MLFLYRENAADLFPQKISHATRENVVDAKIKGRRNRTKVPKGYSAPPARPAIDENLDLEAFPEQFEALANNIVTFGRSLDEFPEFDDEAIIASIISFEGDLRYWASCLQVYQGQFRYPTVQRYVHDLSAEMGEHIDNITSTLLMFVDDDLDKKARQMACELHRIICWLGLILLFRLTLLSVATFFSAVTATGLQSSFNLQGTPVGHAVNSFWFGSLVFSIASVVNSLVDLLWEQAEYHYPPWWVLIWIKRSPLVFLTISVVCFSVGLCLFAYASGQHIVTSTITMTFTIFTFFGLAAVSTWFVWERSAFLRHRWRKLLEKQFLAIPGIAWNFLRGIKKRFRKARKAVARLISKAVNLISRESTDSESNDLEANILPVSNGHSRKASAMMSVTHLPTASPSLDLSAAAPGTLTSLTTAVAGSEAGGAPVTPGPTRGKLLWKNALQTVKMRSEAATPFGPRTPHRQRTSSSTLMTSFGKRKRDEPIKPVLTRARIATLRPKLGKLMATQALEAHQELVKHLQFSLDGKFLATSSWDHTSIIWRVEMGTLTSHRVLAHAQGFVGQVAWSDTGNMLLTKLIRGMKVWTEDGICQKTIDRQTNVESITWFPGSQSFLSVEGNTVTQLDLRGSILDQYDFGRMKLHDVAVTPDGTRLLGVGPLLESPTGLHPSKSPAEKRLVVYNTELKQIEHQTPVLSNVRNVTLARNTRQGLIALDPPQLWKMELLKDRENAALLIARLTLRHTYMPKRAIEFAGPSYFGGKNDELVLCAGKSGDIHIWDQESGMLLRYIPPAQQNGDLSCIAWNHAADDPFMFATGSHDGGVRIWTQPEDPPDVDRLDGDGVMPMARSASPLEIERTDSPLTQAEFEALDVLRRQESTSKSTSEFSVGTAREQTVTFGKDED